jgi:hypothetical protein
VAVPTSKSALGAAVEAARNAPIDWFETTYSHGLVSRLKKPEPPKLRGWWARQWCALRGHGGITNYPDCNTYFMKEGLCKRCGSRVVCS